MSRAAVFLVLLFSVSTLAAAPMQPAPAAATKQKPVAAKRPRVVTVLSGFDLLDKDALNKQAMTTGASRDTGVAPVALAPRLGKLYDVTPQFCWSDSTGGGSYVFTLWDDAQNAVYHHDVQGYRFHYPADAPKLEPGKTYFWTVETPPSMSGSRQSEPVGFVVISGEQRGAVEQKLAAAGGKDEYTRALARAKVLTDARLWYDAVGAYMQMLQQYPARAELYDARGTLFAQLPATHADADQDFAHADQLRTGHAP